MYFKKENDIILSGTLWKEAERGSAVHMTCESPKTLRALRLGGRVPVLPPASGRPGGPSGLFIVESVFTCFIMKNKFAKVY